MAEPVSIPNVEKPAKIANVIGVGALTLVPFYLWWWWYRANRELADYGKARGTDELGTSPGKSLLAVTLGALIIVPAIMSFFRTHKRIAAAQRMVGQEPINGWISVVFYIFFSPAWIAYMQSGLNSTWQNVETAPAAPAGEIQTATEEAEAIEEAEVVESAEGEAGGDGEPGQPTA